MIVDGNIAAVTRVMTSAIALGMGNSNAISVTLPHGIAISLEPAGEASQ